MCSTCPGFHIQANQVPELAGWPEFTQAVCSLDQGRTGNIYKLPGVIGSNPGSAVLP